MDRTIDKKLINRIKECKKCDGQGWDYNPPYSSGLWRMQCGCNPSGLNADEIQTGEKSRTPREEALATCDWCQSRAAGSDVECPNHRYDGSRR